LHHDEQASTYANQQSGHYVQNRKGYPSDAAHEHKTNHYPQNANPTSFANMNFEKFMCATFQRQFTEEPGAATGTPAYALIAKANKRKVNWLLCRFCGVA